MQTQGRKRIRKEKSTKITTHYQNKWKNRSRKWAVKYDMHGHAANKNI
jgi:hypothetical protein